MFVDLSLNIWHHLSIGVPSILFWHRSGAHYNPMKLSPYCRLRAMRWVATLWHGFIKNCPKIRGCLNSYRVDNIQDFLLKLGLKPYTYAYSENHYFCVLSCHCHIYLNCAQPPRRPQNSDSQSPFLVLNFSKVFLIFVFFKNITLGNQLLLMKCFENSDFQNTLFSKNVCNFSLLCWQL